MLLPQGESQFDDFQPVSTGSIVHSALMDLHVAPDEAEKAVDYSMDELDDLMGRDDGLSEISGVDSEVESVMGLSS
jgi:hypothetical protein